MQARVGKIEGLLNEILSKLSRQQARWQDLDKRVAALEGKSPEPPKKVSRAGGKKE